MFNLLQRINTKPKPFQYYTADELWNNDHTAKQMLNYHLNEQLDISSRRIDFINSSIEWITKHFNLTSQSLLLDLGCGPGLYASRFAEKGIDVTGVDFSDNSIKYAKENAKSNNLNINYIAQNYLDFDSEEQFDLIIMIMCDFCALSPSQRKTMLQKMKKLLKPNGSVFMDVYSYNFFDHKSESATYELNFLNQFWSPDDYYCFINSYKYEEEKVLLDQYTIIEQTKTKSVYNWLQCFDENSIKHEFAENGLYINELYSDVCGNPFAPKSTEFAVVANIK